MKKYITIICGLFLCAGALHAATITFDDRSGSVDEIANGYAGLNWNNFWTLDGNSSGYQGTGYQHGIVSGQNVAFNGFGTSAAFSDGSFTLNSAYFTSAWYDNNQITVQGYSQGVLVDSTQFAVNTTGPTFVNFGWSGIDEVRFSSSSAQFAMDNLTINNATVPEGGATAGLLGFSFAGLGLLRRKLGLNK